MADPATPADRSGDAPLASLGPLLDRLESALEEVDRLDDDVRGLVFALLDDVDAVHRLAIVRLAAALGAQLPSLRLSDPAVDWLFEAYGVGVDDAAAASAALDALRPMLREQGGEVEVVGVRDGVVSVRLTGTCADGTPAGAAARAHVEEALGEGLPGFVALEVAGEEPAGSATPVLVQITRRPV